MANIILNSNCNRKCVYCFSHLGNREKKQLTLDNLTVICDFLDRSRKRKVNVLGGEPSLHPQFDLFLEYLISRGYVVHVFTNGMMPSSALEAVRVLIAKRGLTRKRLKFIVNVNEERYRSEEEKRLQAKTFRVLGDFATLSFNIFETGCELDFLAQLIDENRLIPEIRLGLASPVSGKGNRYLQVKSYRGIAQKIYEFSDTCQEGGIDLVFDCGFPLCIFTDEEIGKLYKHKTQLKFTCRPIPDIDPELNVYHCYPLSGYHPRSLAQFRDLGDVRRYFMDLLRRSDLQPGIFETCIECAYRRRGMCAGGCKGHFVTTPNKETNEERN
jgi:radical SAM protein with 4Fe4S-binding SPASM domain